MQSFWPLQTLLASDAALTGAVATAVPGVQNGIEEPGGPQVPPASVHWRAVAGCETCATQAPPFGASGMAVHAPCSRRHSSRVQGTWHAACQVLRSASQEPPSAVHSARESTNAGGALAGWAQLAAQMSQPNRSIEVRVFIAAVYCRERPSR